jgi:hypothetical protein
MDGTIYRLAVALKELGERLRISGIIRMGLWLRERVRYAQIK